ncbi:hypothetical protein F5X99DRAFT_406467 [Biscogniauxia marginata]|nr:hypothetical protein F5X99DRAFT_406467 [Biscogniauxia marginata]
MAYPLVHPDHLAALAAQTRRLEANCMSRFTGLPLFDFTNSPRYQGEKLKSFHQVVMDSDLLQYADQSAISQGICHVIRHSLYMYGDYPVENVYNVNWFWYLVKMSMKGQGNSARKVRPTTQDIDHIMVKNVVAFYTMAFKRGVDKGNSSPVYMAGGGALFTLLAEWVLRSERKLYTVIFQNAKVLVRPPSQENERKRLRLEAPGQEEIGDLEAARKRITELQAQNADLVAQRDHAQSVLDRLRTQLAESPISLGDVKGAKDASNPDKASEDPNHNTPATDKEP